MCIRTNESYIIQIISGDVVTKTFFFGMKHERRDGNGRRSAKITNNQINWNKHDQLGKIYQRRTKACGRSEHQTANLSKHDTCTKDFPFYQSRILHHSILGYTLNRLFASFLKIHQDSVISRRFY